jgi:hypothetical protein
MDKLEVPPAAATFAGVQPAAVGRERLLVSNQACDRLPLGVPGPCPKRARRSKMENQLRKEKVVAEIKCDLSG